MRRTQSLCSILFVLSLLFFSGLSDNVFSQTRPCPPDGSVAIDCENCPPDKPRCEPREGRSTVCCYPPADACEGPGYEGCSEESSLTGCSPNLCPIGLRWCRTDYVGTEQHICCCPTPTPSPTPTPGPSPEPLGCDRYRAEACASGPCPEGEVCAQVSATKCGCVLIPEPTPTATPATPTPTPTPCTQCNSLTSVGDHICSGSTGERLICAQQDPNWICDFESDPCPSEHICQGIGNCVPNPRCSDSRPQCNGTCDEPGQIPESCHSIESMGIVIGCACNVEDPTPTPEPTATPSPTPTPTPSYIDPCPAKEYCVGSCERPDGRIGGCSTSFEDDPLGRCKCQ